MATVVKRSWTDGKGRKKEAWRVSYTDLQGKRYHEQVGSKKDADARRVQIESELALGIHTADAATVTVGQGCELWVAAGEADGLEHGTLRERRRIVRLHIKPLIGARKLARLKVPDVEAFRDALVASRSRATASKAVRFLSSALIECGRRGLVAQNVATNVKVRKSGRDDEPVSIPERQDLKGIIQAAQSLGNQIPEAYPLVLLAVSAGLRGSELRGLRWPDLDLKGKAVTVRQRADERNVLGKLKSKAAYRTIPLAPQVVSALKAWRLRCQPCELDLVFPNRQGRPIHLNSLREDRWQPILIRAKLAKKQDRKDCTGRWLWEHKYGMHDLRHACASRWIKQKVDLKTLTTWMGHASIAITLDIYGHLIKDEAQDAAIVNAAYSELMA